MERNNKYTNLKKYIRQTINPEVTERIKKAAEKRNVPVEKVEKLYQEGNITYEEIVRYTYPQEEKEEVSFEQLTEEEIDMYRRIVVLNSNLSMYSSNHLDFSNTYLTDTQWDELLAKMELQKDFGMRGQIIKSEEGLQVKLEKIKPRELPTGFKKSGHRRTETAHENKQLLKLDREERGKKIEETERLQLQRKKALEQYEMGETVEFPLTHGIKEKGKDGEIYIEKDKVIVLKPEEEER